MSDAIYDRETTTALQEAASDDVYDFAIMRVSWRTDRGQHEVSVEVKLVEYVTVETVVDRETYEGPAVAGVTEHEWAHVRKEASKHAGPAFAAQVHTSGPGWVEDYEKTSGLRLKAKLLR